MIGCANDSTLLSGALSPGVRVTGTESLNRDLCKFSECGDLWGMKLNASETKTMIVTMHPRTPILIIGGTVLKESGDLNTLGVTYDSKMTFESIFTWFTVQLLKGLVS